MVEIRLIKVISSFQYFEEHRFGDKWIEEMEYIDADGVHWWSHYCNMEIK